LLDKIFDFFKETFDIISFANFLVLVLLFPLVICLKVLFTSVNQVELNVEIEVVEVIFLRVDKFAFVVNEIVLSVEKLLAFMMNVERQLLVTVSAFIQFTHVPTLVQAEAD